jgi:hypothetical protein
MKKTKAHTVNPLPNSAPPPVAPLPPGRETRQIDALKRCVGDACAIPCLRSIEVCGQELKAVGLVRAKIDYIKDSDTFTTKLCTNSARKLKKDYPDFSVEELTEGVAQAVVPLIAKALVCSSQWTIGNDAEGTLLLTFTADFADFEQATVTRDLKFANLLEGKSEEDSEMTTHNLRAVFCALLRLTAAFRPFVWKWIPEFYRSCKADADATAAPGSPKHISQIIYRLASAHRPVDPAQTTDLLLLGRISPWFKYINGNSERAQNEYVWAVDNWYDTARLFVPGSSQKGLSMNVSTWDTTVVVGSFERNRFLRDQCSRVGGGDDDDVQKQNLAMHIRQNVRNLVMHQKPLRCAISTHKSSFNSPHTCLICL